jgi:hypothetical protein
MADEAASCPADPVAVLCGISMRIRAGEPADPHEVECVLEVGFGALIALEAELSRAQASARVNPEAHGAVIGELKTQINVLHDALTQLRTLSVPPGEARIGYGFVLPGQHGRAHAHRN